MSHVDEKNFRITLFDLILHEYLLSCEHYKGACIDLISPFLSNYPIPTKWPLFLSNITSISDIDTFFDLLRLLNQNNVPIRLLTLSPSHMVSRTSMSSFSIRRQTDFIKNLFRLGCKIYFDDKIHAKMVITSQGVLEGSANITTTGMETDLQHNSGNYFSKNHEEFYNEKVNYANNLFSNSRESTKKDYILKY